MTGSRMRGRLVASFGAITLVLVAGAYTCAGVAREAINQSDAEYLATVGAFETLQVQQWRRDHLRSVTALVRMPGFGPAVASLTRDAGSRAARAPVLRYLLAHANPDAAGDVLLLSPDGKVLVSTESAQAPVGPATCRTLSAALLKTSAVLSDLYVDRRGVVRVDAAAVVRDAHGHALGIAIERSNARHSLNPVLPPSDGPSDTSEVALVQRDGPDILILGDVARPLTGASVERVPVTRTELPAVQAVRGRQGPFEGRNAFGERVIADLRPVPGSPWFVVTQQNADLHAAAIREHLEFLGGVVGLLILLAGAATAYAYRTQQAGSFREIYESERERREAEEMYRATLYSIGDAVITTDSAGRVRHMNQVAERLTGWTEADARNRPLDEVFRIVNEATHHAVESPVTAALRAGAVVALENRTLLLARDGTQRPITDTAAPVRNDAGTVIGVVLVFSDRTTQHAAERALRATEERLRLALAAANQGIFDLHVETGEVTFTPEYAGMLGFRPEDFHETIDSWSDRLHPDDRERVTRAVAEHLAGHSPSYRVEYRVQNQAGEWRWMLSLGTVVERTADGRAVRMLGTRTDITTQKENEARIVRLSQLYTALSLSSQAIVRSHHADDIFREICGAAVRSGSVQMAWIGLVDEATDRVTPVAASGDGTQYINSIEISTRADEPIGRGPVGTCIRTNEPVWSQDWKRDPSIAPWRRQGEQYNWGSLAALPLRRNGKPIGALALYAGVTHAFDAEARGLLTEMAHDIGFALDTLDADAERKRAQAALAASEARLIRAQQIARMGFLDWDLPSNVIYWSDEVVRLF
ncbi:MAG: PAS domain-containing protein, partial [Gemmatimonadaceae bacterium]